jgi:hypothetical protein
MWAALSLIVILTVLSVYGAFIGAARAQAYFNRVPLVVYWGIFVLTLVVGLVAFHRLIRVPGLLLMHAGCILILLGGSLGSQKGYKATGNDKILKGQMQIYEGQTTNKVFVRKADGDGHDTKDLPFSIKLNDFTIEYYEPKFEYLDYETAKGMQRVAAELGREIDLGAEHGTAKITRKFRNLKVSMDGDKRQYYDDQSPNPNPALEIQITKPDGQVATRFVYSLHPDFSHTPGGPKLMYNRPPYTPISDYISELEIIDTDGKVLVKKNIEVNYPLQYGGYRFYQSGYDDKAARYTVLQVVSDTGVMIVFAGYWMLCIGVIWHMWLRYLFKKIGSKKKTDGN